LLSDNLKITDFGLATVFRFKGRERLLGKCCGTPPYVAPEVLSKCDYYAIPADIWSCGIVLVAMLAGGMNCLITLLSTQTLVFKVTCAALL
jgi:serine/threonine-protein kinase Chk1